MKVKELLAALADFDPEAEVQLCMNWPGRVAETYRRLWVGDHGEGPQINATIDFRGVSIYVGCVLEQRAAKQRAGERASGNPPETAQNAPRGAVEEPSRPAIMLGNYESSEIAARVRDFYVFHKQIDEPLNFPDFDYERWIPPKDTCGEYNKHIAAILREKLLRE